MTSFFSTEINLPVVPKKYNIILDIDETLLNTISLMYSNDLNFTTKGPHNFDFFMMGNQKFLVFMRPHLNEFLDFIENY